MTAMISRTSEASEPGPRPAFAPKALPRVHCSFSEGGSGDRGVLASGRIGGAGPPTRSFGEVSPERASTAHRAKADGAKPPGQTTTRVRCYVLVAAVVTALATGLRLDARQERDAGGFKAPTAALERGRAVYVLNHCHFCHGVDLTRATMGAANLSQSPLVGADEDGNMIGPLVKAGLPNLQTTMPSYSELTATEIVDLARYIHFLRQQARFRALGRLANTPAGDRMAGEAYFNGAADCRSCHSMAGDLAGIGRKYDTAKLRERLLRPGPAMPSEGASPTAGQAAHLKLLETYTAANVQDLVAFLGESR